MKECSDLSIKCNKLCHKDALYNAKLAKKEQEYQRLQDRVQKEVRGKEQSLKRGMTAVAKLRANTIDPHADVDPDAPVGPTDRAMFQRIIDGYEEKCARMERENRENYECVVRLQRQLKTVTNHYDRLRRALLGKTSSGSFVAGSQLPEGDDDPEKMLAEEVEVLSPAPATPTTMARSRAFEWGGDVARTAITASMEEQMKTLQERVRQNTRPTCPSPHTFTSLLRRPPRRWML